MYRAIILSKAVSINLTYSLAIVILINPQSKTRVMELKRTIHIRCYFFQRGA